MVLTLCMGIQVVMLQRLRTAERFRLRSHAERGNDGYYSSRRRIHKPKEYAQNILYN